MRIPTGITDQYIYFVAVDATDLKTRETGLTTWTVYRSRNGAAAAAYTTPTINETDVTNMPGVYELLLDEDMTIDAGDDSQEVCLHITHAGMAPVTRVFELYRPKVTAGETITASGGAVSTVTTVSGNVAGSVGSIAAAGIAANSFAAAALNAISDADLDRNMATGTDSGTDSNAVRTPRQALRVLRNKATIIAGVGTVYKEDDATPSWTAAMTTTAGNPISGVDPTS